MRICLMWALDTGRFYETEDHLRLLYRSDTLELAR